jgi:sterol desaturase/sphingolipid hydroxylase (fatty acid hydroxylase superfamily)
MTGLSEGFARIGDMALGQLAGTFLYVGSTFSIGALAASLAIFLAAMLRDKRRRSLRLRVLLRAAFPRRMLRTASGRTDLAYFWGGILFAGVAIGWAVFAANDVKAALAGVLGPAPALRLPGWAAVPIATLAGFLAYEFAYWFDHWLMHRVPLLWQFHKVHHQAESLSIFTNGRVHPVETILFYNIVAVAMGGAAALTERLLGTGASAATVGGTNLLIMLAAVALTHLQHSHLWLDFGPRGSRWLLGPAHHQIHHSVAREHWDRNLGNTLTVFDRAFGTFFQPPAQRGAMRFGVEDGERAPHSARAALVQPFVDSAAIALRPLRDLARRLVYRRAACSSVSPPSS